jgi:hypothetical protein
MTDLQPCQDHDARIKVLEAFQHHMEIETAREEERRKHIDERFDGLTTQIKEVRNGIRRLVWIVGSSAGGAVLVAAANFVIGGGLAGGQ